MQLRYDGTMGFPGGLVDVGETPEQAASREIREVCPSGTQLCTAGLANVPVPCSPGNWL